METSTESADKPVIKRVTKPNKALQPWWKRFPLKKGLFWSVIYALWRIVEHWADVDFLLSFNSEKAARWFAFLKDYGIWILLLGTLVWIYFEPRPIKKKFAASTLVSSIVVSFIWGVLVGFSVTKVNPQILLI